MKRVLQSVVLAAAGAVGLASAASAQDVRVPYGDLDLRRPADAAVFQQRAAEAADAFCLQQRQRFGGPLGRTSRHQCRREVLDTVRSATPPEQRAALRIARSARGPAPVAVAAR